MRTFFETENTNPFYELDVALSEAAIESADIVRRINMINDTYRVNIACAEHKVLTESGCYSDLEALFEAAEEEKKKAEGGVWASIRRIIDNIINQFKKTNNEKIANKLDEESKKRPNESAVEEGEAAPKESFIRKLINDLTSKITGLGAQIAKGFKENVIVQSITALKNSIGEKIKNFSLKKEGFGPVTFVWSKASELVSFIIGKFADLGNFIKNQIAKLGNKKGVVKEAGESDVQTAGNEPAGKESGSISLGSVLQGFVTWLLSMGSSLVKTIWGALKKGGKAIKNKVTGKGKDKNGENAQTETPANNGTASNNATPAETAAPAETTAKESVNIFGINFEPEDYTLESAFDDDCSEIAALLDIF